MASKIYTRTGDNGKTSLLGGTKLFKSNIRIEAYGTVDELNSFIGLLNDQLGMDEKGVLREIQDRLFTIGSSLACDPEKEPSMRLPDLKDQDIELLEKEIDRMNEHLAPMRSFILPGGNVPVSTAHVVRSVCRRAERCCVRMMEHELFVDLNIIRYLNRLSDYLFILARYIAYRHNVEEIKWVPRK
jgi:cob(I)alamin adenosyltransferase